MYQTYLQYEEHGPMVKVGHAVRDPKRALNKLKHARGEVRERLKTGAERLYAITMSNGEVRTL